VRLTASGDLAFGAAQLGLYFWLWTASPLSPVIHVDTLQAFVDRVRAMFESGDWTLSTILMAGVVFGIVQTLFKMSGALWRLITGRLMPYDKRAQGAVAA
jgi:hypothetical protein